MDTLADQTTFTCAQRFYALMAMCKRLFGLRNHQRFYGHVSSAFSEQSDGGVDQWVWLGTVLTELAGLTELSRFLSQGHHWVDDLPCPPTTIHYPVLLEIHNHYH